MIRFWYWWSQFHLIPIQGVNLLLQVTIQLWSWSDSDSGGHDLISNLGVTIQHDADSYSGVMIWIWFTFCGSDQIPFLGVMIWFELGSDSRGHDPIPKPFSTYIFPISSVYLQLYILTRIRVYWDLLNSHQNHPICWNGARVAKLRLKSPQSGRKHPRQYTRNKHMTATQCT